MNWTEQQLNEYMANLRVKDRMKPAEDVPDPNPVPIVREDTMNKAERAFADLCEMRRHLKEILAWMYEPCRLILSPNVPGKRNAVSYLPDFMVVHKDYFEYVEVKVKHEEWSSMRDDARVKVNIAADKFPWFKFTVAFLEKGEWTFEKV